MLGFSIFVFGSLLGLVRSDVVHIDADHHRHHVGFSSGSSLRSIAQGSADRAHTAVNSQHAAAHQAAFIAQSSLAQEAIQAAATANAALTGKEVLLHGLENQLAEAQNALEGEIQHFELAKAVAISAKLSAETSSNHVLTLSSVLNNANIAAEHAQSVAVHADTELASQTAMIGKAKERLSSSISRFQKAQIDFEATKEATGQATAAAQEAQENATNAGQHAAHAFHAYAAHTGHEVAVTPAPGAHVTVATTPHPTEQYYKRSR